MNNIKIVKYNKYYYIRTFLWIKIIILFFSGIFYQLEDNLFLIILVIIDFLILYIFDYHIVKYKILGYIYFSEQSIIIHENNIEDKIIFLKDSKITINVGNIKGYTSVFLAIFRGTKVFDGTNSKIYIKERNKKYNYRLLIENQKDIEFLSSYLETLKHND